MSRRQLLESYLEKCTGESKISDPSEGVAFIAQCCIMTAVRDRKGAKAVHQRGFQKPTSGIVNAHIGINTELSNNEKDSRSNPSTKASDRTIVFDERASSHFRSLFVQGFYGGAPEMIRDRCLTCLHTLISHGHLFDVSWLVESSDTNDRDGVGKFASLLCSIVSVEIHLLVQEAYSLYYDKEYRETIEKNSDEVIETRKRRLFLMTTICIELFSKFFLFLIGENEESDGLWHSLPYTAMESIKQSIQTTIMEIIDFIKSIGTERPISELDSFPKTFVHLYITCILPYILEDADIVKPFILSISGILQSSVLVKDDSHHEIPNWNECKCYLFIEDLLNYHISDVKESESVSNYAQSIFPKEKEIAEYYSNYLLHVKNDQDRDIFLVLLPYILCISNELETSDESEDIRIEKSRTDQEQIQNNATFEILETLYSSTMILSCTINLGIIFSKALVFHTNKLVDGIEQPYSNQIESNQRISENFDIVEACAIISLSLDYLSQMLRWYKKDMSDIVQLISSSQQITDIQEANDFENIVREDISSSYERLKDIESLSSMGLSLNLTASNIFEAFHSVFPIQAPALMSLLQLSLTVSNILPHHKINHKSVSFSDQCNDDDDYYDQYFSSLSGFIEDLNRLKQ